MKNFLLKYIFLLNGLFFASNFSVYDDEILSFDVKQEHLLQYLEKLNSQKKFFLSVNRQKKTAEEIYEEKLLFFLFYLKQIMLKDVSWFRKEKLNVDGVLDTIKTSLTLYCDAKIKEECFGDLDRLAQFYWYHYKNKIVKKNSSEKKSLIKKIINEKNFCCTIL